MDFLRPGPRMASTQLRALTTVARASKTGLAEPQRALLEAIQQLILETDQEIELLLPISSEELATEIGDPAQARQLIRLMVVMSLADGPPSLEQMSLLSSFAATLGIEEPSVKVIGYLSKGRLRSFRLAFMRRSHIRNYLRNTYRMMGGFLPLVRAILIFRGLIKEDVQTAATYRALGNLPEDSLGYQFFRHCTDAGLPFPGEKGGFPIGALYHDFTHVLAGYDTSPEGEMQAAAFQAGYTQDDHDFFTLLFAIVIHTAGINLAPFPMPVLPGRIGQGQLAMEVVRALQRGAEVKTDLGNDWDFWQCVDRPIDVVRDQLGVRPDSSFPSFLRN